MCAPTLRPFAHSTVAPAGVVWRLQNRRDGVGIALSDGGRLVGLLQLVTGIWLMFCTCTTAIHLAIGTGA